MKINFRKIIDGGFDIGILLKFIHGFSEILSGIFLVTPWRAITNNAIFVLTREEIAEDPHDIVANYLVGLGNSISGGINLFAVFYLLFHGAVNTAIAIALFKKKLWAYPVAIVIFGLFIIYQAYRYFYTHSFTLLILTVVDIIIVVFVALEYRKIASRQKVN